MESHRKDSKKGGEQFHASKDQYWREPDVMKLWRDHLYHMKRQQMPEIYSPSVTEGSDIEWDDIDDEIEIEGSEDNDVVGKFFLGYDCLILYCTYI